MAFNILAEALARIEHKLDQLLRVLVYKNGTPQKMGFSTGPCPICGVPVTYQIDIGQNVVVRVCGCRTGLFSSTIPLQPVEQKGVTNASGISGADSASDGEGG